MSEWKYWSIGIALGVISIVLLYAIFAAAPHCAEWKTLRETTPPYTEYTWNPWARKMVATEHPEQTFMSWQYCTRPLE